MEASWKDFFFSDRLKEEQSRVAERGGELVKVCMVQRPYICRFLVTCYYSCKAIMGHLNSNESHSQLLQVSQHIHPLTYCAHDTCAFTAPMLLQTLLLPTKDQLNHYDAFIKCGNYVT